jgi:hypothetical protein
MGTVARCIVLVACVISGLACFGADGGRSPPASDEGQLTCYYTRVCDCPIINGPGVDYKNPSANSGWERDSAGNPCGFEIRNGVPMACDTFIATACSIAP